MCISTLFGAISSAAIGAKCSRNSNCLYNICTDGVCTAPSMTCHTSVAGKTQHPLPLLDPTFLARMLQLPKYVSIVFRFVYIVCCTISYISTSRIGSSISSTFPHPPSGSSCCLFAPCWSFCWLVFLSPSPDIPFFIYF